MNASKILTLMKHRYSIFTFFFFLYTLPLMAQITLLIPDKRVVKEGFVDAEVRVKTRDSITALQFLLTWDPNVLEYSSIENLSLQGGGTIEEIFGLNNIYDGNIKFIWISNAANGIKLVDSAMIFKVKFKAIGNKGASSKVKFDSTDRFKIKAIRANLAVETIPMTVRQGTITIEGTSAAQEVSDTEGSITLYQNAPNPITHQTVIPFNLRDAQVVNLKIYDIVGRVVYDKSVFFNNGKQEWALNTEGVLEKGIYLYSLKTNKGIVTKTMIKN
jgi:hypothetical protein